MDLKPQDLLFAAVLFFLLFRRNPKWFVWAGLISLLLSIPLFQQWVFFTAQRLTWYAFAFFAIAVLMNLLERKSNS